MLANLVPKLASRGPQLLEASRGLNQLVRRSVATSKSNSPDALQKVPKSDQVDKFEEQERSLGDIKEQKPLIYPEQHDWLEERQVRISRPSKNVMQSGTAYTNTWKIEFNSTQRWENWLMGWTSSADPVSNLSLTFPTKEAAIEFCEKNQLQWFVEEQPERKFRRKSYAENFSWDKRTRTSNK